VVWVTIFGDPAYILDLRMELRSQPATARGSLTALELSLLMSSPCVTSMAIPLILCTNRASTSLAPGGRPQPVVLTQAFRNAV